MAARYVVDWERVITEVRQRGLSTNTIARYIDVPRRTLGAWMDGCQPAHDAGERLIAVWCTVCDRSRIDVPMIAKPLSAADILRAHQ